MNTLNAVHNLSPFAKSFLLFRPVFTASFLHFKRQYVKVYSKCPSKSFDYQKQCEVLGNICSKNDNRKKEICLLKWKDVPDATICGKFNILIRALCQKRASTCGLRFNYFKKTHAKCANKNLMNCQIRWKSIQIFLCFSQKIQDNPKIGFIILLTTWRTFCVAYHAWGNSVSNNFSFFLGKSELSFPPRC